jgi:uncharacterized protein YuzE
VKLKYDPRHNVAYLSFREKTEQVETLEISEEMNIDIAPDGSVYGIELLNANEQLKGDDGLLIVLNEAAGKTGELELGI